MPKKIAIPAKVAEAIETIRDLYPETATYEIAKRVTDLFTYHSALFDTLRSIPFGDLMDAVVNGYETERTAEDAIREEYTAMITEQGSPQLMARNQAYASGIVFTLNALEIYIGGVNA